MLCFQVSGCKIILLLGIYKAFLDKFILYCLFVNNKQGNKIIIVSD